MEKIILSNWFDAYNQRDWAAMQEIYTDNSLIHGKEKELRGGAAIVELAKKWLKAIPDIQLTPLNTSKEGHDVVVVHWRAEGTFTNSIRDIEATGKKIAFHGLTCFRFLNEKVVEHWATVDYRPLRSEESSSAV